MPQPPPMTEGGTVADEYEYFVRTYRPLYTIERPGELWRRSGDAWGYWSSFNQRWQRTGEDHVTRPPPEGSLFRVTPERAAELVADPQSWVRYWALYREDPDKGGEPRTVVRRRISPEQLLDEIFGRDDQWFRTTALIDFESAWMESIDFLVEIDQETAESIIQRISGVSGATEL
jgi:hypothetical protein